jgi:hypothetical protein
MKQVILLFFILIKTLFVSAQTQKHDFGTCFGKGNLKSINNKMEKFLTRVSDETGCPKDKLTYTIDEFYTVFYTKSCRHLPKKITFEVCGKKRTYEHMGLSGNITYWLLGSWALDKD